MERLSDALRRTGISRAGTGASSAGNSGDAPPIQPVAEVQVGKPDCPQCQGLGWVGMDVPKPNQRPLYRRLWSKRIQVMPHRALQEIRRGAVTVTNVFTFEPEEIEPVDSVVFVSGRRSNDELRTLFDDGREVFMIGDCVAPRTIGDAIREGEAVGRAL